MALLIEDYLPVVKYNGLNTAKDIAGSGSVSFSGPVNLGSVSKKVPKFATTSATLDAQAATATIAQLLGGIILQNSKTGASTLTTPTGAEISAGISDVAVGMTFDVVFDNYGDQTSTITAGASGVTVVGTAAVPTTKTALLRFVNTAANTWIVYVVLSA